MSRYYQPKYGRWTYVKHHQHHKYEGLKFISLSITLGLLSILSVHLGTTSI